MNDSTPESPYIDEGYVKYTSEWAEGPPPDAVVVESLNHWRALLYRAGLVGYDEEHGVGFGNISMRGGGQFVISGTQTGHIEHTSGQHYALVTDVDIDANRAACVGPVQASSEAMTHAALYALDPEIGAVVHTHSRALWQQGKDTLPTTDADVAYGTPAMAREFARLWRETDFRHRGVAVMAGHADGLISVGSDLEQAAMRVLELLQST